MACRALVEGDKLEVKLARQLQVAWILRVIEVASRRANGVEFGVVHAC